MGIQNKESANKRWVLIYGVRLAIMNVTALMDLVNQLTRRCGYRAAELSNLT